jgi:hypothetical protein
VSPQEREVIAFHLGKVFSDDRRTGDEDGHDRVAQFVLVQPEGLANQAAGTIPDDCGPQPAAGDDAHA